MKPLKDRYYVKKADESDGREIEQKPMGLHEALRLLVDVHTRDHHEIGFTVPMGATPDFPYHRDHYVEAWRTVRRSIGMPTKDKE